LSLALPEKLKKLAKEQHSSLSFITLGPEDREHLSTGKFAKPVLTKKTKWPLS